MQVCWKVLVEYRPVRAVILLHKALCHCKVRRNYTDRQVVEWYSTDNAYGTPQTPQSRLRVGTTHLSVCSGRFQHWVLQKSNTQYRDDDQLR